MIFSCVLYQINAVIVVSPALSDMLAHLLLTLPVSHPCFSPEGQGVVAAVGLENERRDLQPLSLPSADGHHSTASNPHLMARQCFVKCVHVLHGASPDKVGIS